MAMINSQSFFIQKYLNICVVLTIFVIMLTPQVFAEHEEFDSNFQSKNGKPLGFLHVGQEVDVVFTLDEIKNTTNIRGEFSYSITTQDNVLVITDSKYFDLKPNELPKTLKFPFIPKDKGSYLLYRNISFDSSQPILHSDSMSPVVVVEKFSKSMTDTGICKTDGLFRAIKPGYSTAVCVYAPTLLVLKERGWP